MVAIGTHDLDHIQGPFTYEALPPKEICFIALNQEKALNAQELFENYEKVYFVPFAKVTLLE